jgi:hypothetical protein
MIEIQTSTELEAPAVAVCERGNICLYLPSQWDINDALNHCEQELLSLLRTRFTTLFADRNFPRSFNMTADRLAIRPDAQQLANSEAYFKYFFGD